jgi:hypothetical protein
MEEILSRCGFRCDLCLAFKPNIEKNRQNQQKLSDGWFKYFGFRIPPDKIICEGCLSDSPDLLDSNCPVRPCVLEKGLENCAKCEDYICEKLMQRMVSYEEIQQKHQDQIPEEDYICFIKPYENKQRLATLRISQKGMES